MLTRYDGDVIATGGWPGCSLMKVMSEMREGMWAVVQQAISTLDDVDFVAYAERAPRPLRRARRRRAVRRVDSARASAIVVRRCERAPGSSSSVAASAAPASPTTSAALGWSDVVLVERDQLTSGSTFHSAGLVGQLRSSVTLTRMMMYGTELYRRLGAETGHDPDGARSGRCAWRRSPARLEELRRQAGWAATFGLPLELVSTAEALELFHGLFDPAGVLGAVLPADRRPAQPVGPDDGAGRRRPARAASRSPPARGSRRSASSSGPAGGG